MEREGGVMSEREEANTYTGLGFTKQEQDDRVHDRELVLDWRDDWEPFNTKIPKGEAAWDSLPGGPWHRQPQTIEVTCPPDAVGGEQIALDGVIADQAITITVPEGVEPGQIFEVVLSHDAMYEAAATDDGGGGDGSTAASESAVDQNSSEAGLPRAQPVTLAEPLPPRKEKPSPKPKLPKQTKGKKKSSKKNPAKKKAAAAAAAAAASKPASTSSKPEAVAVEVVAAAPAPLPEGVPPLAVAPALIKKQRAQAAPPPPAAADEQQEQAAENDEEVAAEEPAEAEAEAAMEVVQVAVPEGVGPGDVITLSLENGDEVEVEVPEGLGPGDVFEVATGPAEEQEEQPEGGQDGGLEVEEVEFGAVTAGRRVMLAQREWEVVQILEEEDGSSEDGPTMVEMQSISGGGGVQVQQFPLEEVSAALKRTLQWDTTTEHSSAGAGAGAGAGRRMAAEAAPTTAEAPAPAGAQDQEEEEEEGGGGGGAAEELPEGWTSGKLGNGTEFWFRIDNPSDVSWTFPT